MQGGFKANGFAPLPSVLLSSVTRGFFGYSALS